MRYHNLTFEILNVFHQSLNEIIDMAKNHEKLHKYDLLAGGVSLLHGCTSKIIPYVLSWDGIVTKDTSNNWGFLIIYVGILLQEFSKGFSRLFCSLLVGALENEVGDAEQIERAASKEVDGTSALSAEIGGQLSYLNKFKFVSYFKPISFVECYRVIY